MATLDDFHRAAGVAAKAALDLAAKQAAYNTASSDLVAAQAAADKALADVTAFVGQLDAASIAALG